MNSEYEISMIILPLIIFIAGFAMLKWPPKSPNWFVGYRTRRSSQSQEAWDFAQATSGRYCAIAGVLTTLATCAILLLDNIFVITETFSTVVVILQLAVLMGVVPYTERKLKDKEEK